MSDEFITLQSALAGEYSLEREIGRGGMGIVFLAREVHLNRLVAIKVLPRALAQRADVRERFLREARTAAGLSHPNIVPIHRVGEAAGLPFFAMTYVNGQTLGDRLRDRGPVPHGLLTSILREVAQALGYAHSRGVVHRDVKPDNILLEESGRAMVTDFGIATVEDHHESVETDVAGTAMYMSPEQAMGAQLDGRSDIYSLGVVAHVALTGRLPGRGEDATEILRRRVAEDVPPIRSVSSAVPESLAKVVDQCLQRAPVDRFDNAESVAAALERHSGATRAELPLPLRLWAQQPTPFLTAYAVWTIGFLGGSAGEWYGWYTGASSGADRWSTFWAACMPVVPLALYQLRKTARVLRAGYTIADIRLALRAWISERQDALSFEIGRGEATWARVLRWMPLSFAAATAGLSILNSGYRNRYNFGFDDAAGTSMVLGILSFLALTGLGVPLLPPRAQRFTTGLARSWLWNSRFGAWIAARLTPKNRVLAPIAFRPTEVALSIAVDELYAALPTEYRASLGDVPEVAQRLTARVTRLRNDIEMLSALAQTQNDPHSVERLAEARSDLTESVATMERLRLDLLRLHGGLIDLQPMTTTLNAARSIIGGVRRLSDAQAELGLMRPLAMDNRTPTPA
jgi:serine/threonine-protein kinase